MLVGHPDQRKQFEAALASGRLHHAWLLTGPRGIGKRRFADLAALQLLAGQGADISEEHPVARLVAAGSHPDHRVLAREVDEKGKVAAEIKVDQVRALQALFRSTPGLGAWRTVIIDSIDDMNRAAANSFLKSLEEPPVQTVFFLISHAPARLLPTIRSRCRSMGFRKLGTEQCREVLEAAGVEPERLDALTALADGAPGEALRFAGEGVDGLGDAIESLLRGGDLTTFARQFQPQSAQARMEALTILAPRRLAQAARRAPSAELLTLYERADTLAQDAVRLAYDRVQVAFALGQLLVRAGQLEGKSPRP
ncbi:MAG: DNA polymerase III subunit delta' [Sphingomonadaceae bacterium]